MRVILPVANKIGCVHACCHFEIKFCQKEGAFTASLFRALEEISKIQRYHGAIGRWIRNGFRMLTRITNFSKHVDGGLGGTTLLLLLFWLGTTLLYPSVSGKKLIWNYVQNLLHSITGATLIEVWNQQLGCDRLGSVWFTKQTCETSNSFVTYSV